MSLTGLEALLAGGAGAESCAKGSAFVELVPAVVLEGPPSKDSQSLSAAACWGPSNAFHELSSAAPPASSKSAWCGVMPNANRIPLSSLFPWRNNNFLTLLAHWLLGNMPISLETTTTCTIVSFICAPRWLTWGGAV